LKEKAKLGVLEGHVGPVSGVAFCPDGRGLLSVGWDGIARLWDGRVGRMNTAYQWELGRLLSLAIAPDGMTAAAGAEGGMMVVWDLDPLDE
jgi:WD40 repeat protein